MANRPDLYNDGDLPWLIENLRKRRKQVEKQVEEQGKDISHEFPITFCQRIEAVLALMHVRPMFEIMTADNSMLRGEAMQPGNQRKALLARINLPQIKAQNHLADMAFLIKGTKHFDETYGYRNKAGASLTQQSTMAELVAEIVKMGRG